MLVFKLKILKILPLNPILKGLFSAVRRADYVCFVVGFVRPFAGKGTCERTDKLWRDAKPRGTMFNTKIKRVNEKDGDTALSVGGISVCSLPQAG